jgi:hypothetical protein
VDIVTSIDASENNRAFLCLHDHLAVKSAIRNSPMEIFNGVYWNDLHTATTISVAPGDVVLLKVARVASCPGLDEQIAYSYPTRANDALDRANYTRQVSSPRLSFSSANIYLVVYWAMMP